MPPKRLICLSAPPSGECSMCHCGHQNPGKRKSLTWNGSYTWPSVVPPTVDSNLIQGWLNPQMKYKLILKTDCIKSGAPGLGMRVAGGSLGKYSGLSKGIKRTLSLLSIWRTPSRSLPPTRYESPPAIPQLIHPHSQPPSHLNHTPRVCSKYLWAPVSTSWRSRSRRVLGVTSSDHLQKAGPHLGANLTPQS